MASINKSIKTKNELERIYDDKTKTTYEVGRFLGKGGFAKCYEFQNIKAKTVYAGKVVPKVLLTKEQQKDKIAQEISIHRGLSHRYIVGFHSFFEDSKNVYIILDLCRKRSMLEMLKRRQSLTEPEVRYFVRQMVLACIYLHQHNVIHRDLKLGNLFINDDMEVQVGDFGLATRVTREGEKKRTLCGTPNYIAPEILNKHGHSFEVDVWSLGCIIYTLLVGVPPFETRNLKDTYSRIRRSDYSLPPRIGKNAKKLIQAMLQLQPFARPSMTDVLSYDFFTEGYIPQRLPVSCLTMPPRFSATQSGDTTMNGTTRKPFQDINKECINDKVTSSKPFKKTTVPECEREVEADYEQEPRVNESPDCYLSDLCRLLSSVIARFPTTPEDLHDEALDPAAVPFIWISKWVDYTDKYGLGYQLCDNSCGVLFNDSTRLIMLADNANFHYMDRTGNVTYYTAPNYPLNLQKKVTLMSYFRTYMTDNLVKAGGAAKPKEGDEFTQVPYLRAWFRTKTAMVFHMTNGTLQLNFFDDHTKIILCPLMGAVSFIDEKKEFSVYKLKNIERYGCSETLFARLQYAKSMAEKLSTAQIVAGKAVMLKSEAGRPKKNPII